MILQTGVLYFGYLAWGCFVLLPLVKLQEVGQGFYRFFAWFSAFVMFFALGGMVFLGDSLPSQLRSAQPAALAFTFVLVVYALALRARSITLLRVLYAAASLTGFAATCALPLQGAAGTPWLLLRAITASLTLGSGVLAMMLGHWYLTVPKLSIDPLKRYSGLYILFTVLTTVELGAAWIHFVGWNLSVPVSEAGARLALGEMVFTLFRVTWGVMAPLGMSYWIWNTVKIRSTQSATGILYAAMTTTLIGELLGVYLTLATGVPF